MEKEIKILLPKGRFPILSKKYREYLTADFAASAAIAEGVERDVADRQESYLAFDGAACREYIVRFSTDESFSAYAERRTGEKRVNLATLLPNTKYYVRVYSADDESVCSETASFETEDCIVRPLDFTDRENKGPRNVRDVGGYATANGKRVKYGMAYRGTLLNDCWNDGYKATDGVRAVMKDEMGIRAELDLRTAGKDDINILDEKKTPQTKNELDASLPYYKFPIEQYDKIFSSELSRRNLREIFRVLANEENYPVYVHCNAGADRTGTLVFLLHGLLGVSYEDATRSYELTTFSPQGKRTRAYIQHDDEVNYVKMGKLYEDIMTYGDTFQTATENFLRSIGATDKDLQAIKAVFTE